MYKDLIRGLEPEIIERELILDGTNENYRVLRQRYFVNDRIIDEIFQYKNNPKSPAWSAIKNHYFEDAVVDNVETFREWTISNHPIRTDIRRVMYLVSMVVNTTEIRITTIIKHYRPNGQKADMKDVIITRIGTNQSKTYEADGMSFGERDYWDYMTNQGFTPYQLLDIRIPQMDSEGYFKNY